MTPRPPAGLRLDADERRAWNALAPKLVALGCYLPLDAVALAMLCESWCLHVRTVRALASARGPLRASLVALREETRHTARSLAADFLVLPRERVALGEVDATGEDLELRRLFDPGAVLRRVRLDRASASHLAAWNARALSHESNGGARR